MKNNTKKLIWDITNVKTLEDITPSLTKSKILSTGISVEELENLVKHAVHKVLGENKPNVVNTKSTPWYKKALNWITRKK